MLSSSLRGLLKNELRYRFYCSVYPLYRFTSNILSLITWQCNGSVLPYFDDRSNNRPSEGFSLYLILYNRLQYSVRTNWKQNSVHLPISSRTRFAVSALILWGRMKTFVYIWDVLFFRFCRYIFVGLVYWYSFVPVHTLTLCNIFLKYKNRNITVSLKATYSFLFNYLFIFCSCKSCVSLQTGVLHYPSRITN